MNDQQVLEQMLTGLAVVKACLSEDYEGALSIVDDNSGVDAFTGLLTVSVIMIAQAYDLEAVTPATINALQTQISKAYLESFEDEDS